MTISTTKSKIKLEVPSINTNGSKFYIIDNGKPVAVKLVETYVTAAGDVRGHFKLGNGKEILNGKLGREYAGCSNCLTMFSDVDAIKRKDYSFRRKAYATLEDLYENKTMERISLNCPYFNIVGPFASISAVDRGYWNDTNNYEFSCDFYDVNSNTGAIGHKGCSFNKIVFSNGKWCFCDDDLTPAALFRENMFPTEHDAKAYLAKRLVGAEALDFDDEAKKDKASSISVTIRVGDKEYRKELSIASDINIIMGVISDIG